MSSSSLTVNKNSEMSFTETALDFLAPKNPVTQERQFRIIPEWWVHTIGTIAYYGATQKLSNKHCKYDTDLQGRPLSFKQLIRETGMKIAEKSDRPDLPYAFRAVASKVENAWCMPGGKIAFYEGLIRAFESEYRDFGVGTFTLEEKVAAILGHEIAHAAASHVSRGYELGLLVGFILSSVADLLVAFFGDEEGDVHWVIDTILYRLHYLSYALIITSRSRPNEFEADKYGMVYLQRSGYNPAVAIWLQEFFASDEPKTGIKVMDWAMSYFFLHPYAQERAKANRETLKLIQAGVLR